MSNLDKIGIMIVCCAIACSIVFLCEVVMKGWIYKQIPTEKRQNIWMWFVAIYSIAIYALVAIV